MSLKLMYITNDPRVATIAENAGVDRIWVDLEWMGKEERQFGMDTVKSNHVVSDVAKLRPFVRNSELMVRVNPIHEKSKEEINAVILGGADLVMLPYFHSPDEVKEFIRLVSGRAKVMLLLETKEAYERLQEIVKIQGIDEIHIGLNDLHLSYGMSFMFELLANGMVENACRIIERAGILYGFGGIAKLGEGMLPAENILTEHYRLGSSMVILSRSFCNTCTDKPEAYLVDVFNTRVRKIRNYEIELNKKDDAFFQDNKIIVKEKINQIVKTMKEKNVGDKKNEFIK